MVGPSNWFEVLQSDLSIQLCSEHVDVIDENGQRGTVIARVESPAKLIDGTRICQNKLHKQGFDNRI